MIKLRSEDTRVSFSLEISCMICYSRKMESATFFLETGIMGRNLYDSIPDFPRAKYGDTVTGN